MYHSANTVLKTLPLHTCVHDGGHARSFVQRNEQELSAEGCASIQPYGIRMNIGVDEERSDRKLRSMILHLLVSYAFSPFFLCSRLSVSRTVPECLLKRIKGIMNELGLERSGKKNVFVTSNIFTTPFLECSKGGRRFGGRLLSICYLFHKDTRGKDCTLAHKQPCWDIVRTARPRGKKTVSRLRAMDSSPTARF
jgi:hypothetical protein